MASGRRLAMLLAVLAPFFLAPAVALAQTASGPLAPSRSPICDRLTRIVRSHPALEIGLSFVDLGTGQRRDINASRVFPAASLYKTLVLAEVYRQVSLGRVALDEPITLEPRHSVDDVPALKLTEPFTTTLGDAAFALRERLGFEDVDRVPRWLAMPGTRFDMDRVVTTAADQAKLFAELYHGRVAGQTSSEAMLRTMRRQDINTLIPAGLPEDVEVAHKTGILNGYLHDAGIVYAPGGDYVLVILTRQVEYEDPAEVIQMLSMDAFAEYATPRLTVPPAPGTARALPVPRRVSPGDDVAASAARGGVFTPTARRRTSTPSSSA